MNKKMEDHYLRVNKKLFRDNCVYLVFLISISSFFIPIIGNIVIEKDDSDPVDGRSGLTIYKDNLTGCQYLSTGMGYLIERWDGPVHIGCKNEHHFE